MPDGTLASWPTRRRFFVDREPDAAAHDELQRSRLSGGDREGRETIGGKLSHGTGGTTPLLFVSDVDAGLRFYTEKLGFHIDWSYDESECDPYICISRGGTEFHLTGCQCPDKRHIGNLWVRVECDQIDSLFQEIKAASVKILDGPTNQPWDFGSLTLKIPMEIV